MFAPAPPPRWTIAAGRVARVRDRPGQRGHDVVHDVADDHDAGHHAAARAICAASAALRRTSATLASSVAPPVLRWKRSSRNGVVALPRTPCGRRGGERLRRARGRAARDRPARSSGSGLAIDDRAVAEPQPGLGAHHRRDLLGRVDPPRHREAGVGEVEAGEAVGAVAEHGHVERLEPLQRGLHVEDRLDAGAHHGDARGGERGQVGRLVPALARLAVHAAEARRWRRRGCPRGRRGATSTRPSSPPSRRRPSPARGRARRPSRSRRRAPAPPARRRRGRRGPRRRRPRSWPARRRPPRTTASSSRATSRLRPRGRPCAISVLSRATTGSPEASAAATSGAIRTLLAIDWSDPTTRPSVELDPVEWWLLAGITLSRLVANGVDEVPSGPRTRRRDTLLVAGQLMLLAGSIAAAAYWTRADDWEPLSPVRRAAGAGAGRPVPLGPHRDGPDRPRVRRHGARDGAAGAVARGGDRRRRRAGVVGQGAHPGPARLQQRRRADDLPRGRRAALHGARGPGRRRRPPSSRPRRSSSASTWSRTS